MKILIMADQDVGMAVTQWLITNYQDDIVLIVTTGENNISELARQSTIPNLYFESNQQIFDVLAQEKIDFGLLVWWPKIITQDLISLATHGFVNTHPSFLPYGRGKHYNFWALVEESPFGVSLHLVNSGIDSGDIIAQSEIVYDWEDNGESLYKKAKAKMISLIQVTYPLLRALEVKPKKQDLHEGSFHFAKEIHTASMIDLEQKYTARELLNLLRARTFPPFPGCWFEDGGIKYEIRVQITRKTDN
jgi:methionyl-tRNA formyltransferase